MPEFRRDDSGRFLRLSGMLAMVLACLPLTALAAPCSDAVIDAQAQLQTDEGRLTCVLDIQVRHPKGESLECAKTPLLLPLLAPAVGNAVLDAGTLPPTSQHVELQTPDGVVVKKEQGGLLLASDVAAGSAAGLRVRYPIAFVRPDVTLAVRGAAARTWYSVVLQSQPPARLQLRVDQPSRVSRLEQGTERLVGAALAQPLKNGEVARFVLGDLPAEARWPKRWLALGAGVLALLAVGLAVAGPRTKQVAPRQAAAPVAGV